ncbi:MAG: hypothetical protein BAJATHORv1_20125 [Candidatus Thorarchaeota archaeon]|nr:MAG: hypothetical protein BAJATHORv1_20125 [Candidatus Thorarchaeota archaeon]
MNEVEPVEELFPRMLEKFNESPRGWRVLSTPRGEMLFVGTDTSYQVKAIPLGPKKFTGAGIEIPNPGKAFDAFTRTPEYGLRPLESADLRNLVEAMQDPSLTSKHLQEIIRRDPIAPRDIDPNLENPLLTGPVLTRPDLSSLGGELGMSQKRLNEYAQEQFRKRYPMRAGMYF